MRKDKRKEILDRRDRVGQTALLIAAAEGFVEFIEVLIAAGPDINAQGLLGNSSLHLAAESDLSKVVEVLIKANAKVCIENDVGQTPHEIALASEA